MQAGGDVRGTGPQVAIAERGAITSILEELQMKALTVAHGVPGQHIDQIADRVGRREWPLFGVRCHAARREV